MKNFPFSKCLFVLLSVALASVRSSPAAAQYPQKGQYALGFTAGLSEPFASDYSSGWGVDGSFDYYVSSRIGLRGSAGYSHSCTSLGDGFSRVSFLASGVYQFDLGSIHPFGRAGVGLYVVSPPGEGSRARVGAHVGGGLEWYFRRRVSLTGEALVHLMGSAAGRSASSFSLAAGLRYYF